MISPLVFAVIGFGQKPASIDDFVQKNLKDISFSARVLKSDQRELTKISKDFGESYRFATTRLSYKEPMKVRVEAHVEDTTVLYILDGPTQYVRVPRSGIKQRTDLTNQPGRRQTPLDFGIVTPSLFDDLFVPTFVRWDRATGDAVFDFAYAPRYKYKAHYRVWLNPTNKCIDKREWYNHHDTQVATFFYESPIEVQGIHIPTKLTVKNIENKVAAMTSSEQITVNSGLPDSTFAVPK